MTENAVSETYQKEFLNDLIALMERTLKEEEISMIEFSKSTNISYRTLMRLRNKDFESKSFSIKTLETIAERCGRHIVLNTEVESKAQTAPSPLIHIDTQNTWIVVGAAIVGALIGYLLTQK